VYPIRRIVGRGHAEIGPRALLHRFRSAFQDAPIGIGLADLDWRFVEVNGALCQLLGYSPEELSRTTVRAITHPLDVESMMAEARQLLAGQTARFQAEQRYLHADGHAGWALISVSLMRERGGRPAYYVLGMDDITRQKTERLRTMPEALTRMLVEAPTLEGASRALLQRLCEELGWQIGQLWIRDREDDVLRLQDFWHAPSLEAGPNVSSSVTTHPETDLPSQVVAAGKHVWIVDLVSSNSEAGPARALTDGLRGAFGFPVLNGSHVTGVVNFYGGAVAEPGEDLLGMVKELGAQLGRFIERRRAERAVQVTSEHVRGVLDNVADGIISTDESGVVEFFNRAAQRLFGYALAEVRGQDAKMLIAEPYRRDFVSHLDNYLRPGKSAASVSGSRELWGQRKDGSIFPMEFRASEMLLGGERRFVGILHDISAQRAQKDALEYQSLHDPLTGLPNRMLFNDRLRQAIVVGHRAREPVVLLMMDMDRFKEVNDTLGHQVGDLLLQQVALRLAATLRQSDTVARLGGDEFAVLPASGTDLNGGTHAAKKILQALEHPFVVDGRNIDVGASIGIAHCPEHGEEADTLMRHADVAMYVAKRTKRGYAIYAPQLDEHTAAHLALIGELRHAIGHNELVLHYQPTVALASGRTIGVEALVRWQHPKQGLIPPDQFIPAAEETELVQPLAHWVLNQGLSQLRSWNDTGLDVGLAVNLSSWNLRDPEFPELASGLLDRWSVQPNRLNLEITESGIMAPSAIFDAITHLSTLGIGLSIDDFGTGYSSLARLKRLPVNEIKIDKSFIIGMMADAMSVSIVRSVIELGHNMGLRVVAEGVENREAWEKLVTLGCDLAQGHYLCPPMPATDLTRWFRESGLGPQVQASTA
jgi:diguanylate cyclase (GGDEF)-like protein/PAS domain S-box-containing protein